MGAFTGLAIATPCYGGAIASPFFTSVIKTVEVCRARGIPLTIHTVAGDSLVSRARAILVAKFLLSDASHLLFIDADMSWQPESVVRLLEADKDFVCGTYRTKIDEVRWAFGVFRDEQGRTPCEQNGELVQIAACGMGFAMIRRAVFERLIAAHPERRFGRTRVLAPEEERFCYDLFPLAAQGGVYVGEDYGFCRLWRELGGEIWLNNTIQLGHHGPTCYAGDPRSVFRFHEEREEEV